MTDLEENRRGSRLVESVEHSVRQETTPPRAACAVTRTDSELLACLLKSNRPRAREMAGSETTVAAKNIDTSGRVWTLPVQCNPDRIGRGA
jgi:hypothetical protein